MNGNLLVSTRLLAPLVWAFLVGFGCAERDSSFYFSYNHHGEDWSEGECASRDRQSPIDFSYKAPWSCAPPVLAYLRQFLGPEYFRSLGFAAFAGDDDVDAPPAMVGGDAGDPLAAGAPGPAPLSPAPAALLEISQYPMMATGPPLPMTPPTPPPMIVPGCGQIGAFFFRYDPVEKPLSIQNNGHTISTDMKGHGLGSINWEGFLFDVLSVNFHVHSEHTFKGKSMPLELHIVHREPETDHILVVAVPFDEFPAPAASSALLQRNRNGRRGRFATKPAGLPNGHVEPTSYGLGETRVIDTELVADAAHISEEEEAQIIPAHRDGPKEPKPTDPGFSQTLANLITYPMPRDGETKTIAHDGPVDLLTPLLGGSTVMPEAFFQYRGSLTAPPCSEQVTWLVRKEPLYASKSQIETLRVSIMEANSNFANSRSTMPLMGRHILYRLAINGEAPPPASVVNDPNVVPKERHADFRGVAAGKEAMRRAMETSQAKDVLAEAMARAQAARGAAMPFGAGAAANPMGPDGLMMTTPLPTPNPERQLLRIVDAVATQMDGSEKAAAMAAAGVVMPVLPPGWANIPAPAR